MENRNILLIFIKTKTNIMTVLQQLQAEKESLSIKTKVAKYTYELLEAFINRDEYTFKFAGSYEVKLFDRDRFFYFGKLQFKTRDFTHYAYMIEKARPLQRKKVLNLKSKLRFIEKNIDADGVYNIISSIVKEEFK